MASIIYLVSSRPMGDLVSKTRHAATEEQHLSLICGLHESWHTCVHPPAWLWNTINIISKISKYHLWQHTQPVLSEHFIKWNTSERKILQELMCRVFKKLILGEESRKVVRGWGAEVSKRKIQNKKQMLRRSWKPGKPSQQFSWGLLSAKSGATSLNGAVAVLN